MADDRKFIIRMGNGLFFERMKGFDPHTTTDQAKAYRFDSRFAALQICATTHLFAGSYILVYKPSQSQPEAQGAIRAHLEGE